MSEGYKVISITALPTSVNHSSLKEVVRYPPHKMPDVVTTEIALWEVGTNTGSTFSWSYWKSFFTHVPEFSYNVILRQDASAKWGGGKLAFLLYESTDLKQAQESFKQIKATMEPLVDSCFLILTLELLKEIVLPKPVLPQQLSHHLTEVMSTNPDAYPDWTRVMRAFVLSPTGAETDDQSDDVFDKIDVHATDSHGNTLLHQAASKGSAKVWKRVTAKLMKRDSQQLLGTINEEGETPVQIAFRRNFPDLVYAIMKSEIKLSDYRDSNGCTPLHLAAESGCDMSIEAAIMCRSKNKKKSLLLTRNSLFTKEISDAINSLNNDGFTPLMVATQKGSVGSVASLLIVMADIDIQHLETGDTALHMAAKMGLASMVRALIAFRANIYIKNNAGKTALDEARESEMDGSEGCIQVLEETTRLIEAAEAELIQPAEILPLDPEAIVALCVDGGGNKGIVAIQVLIYLYERMRKLDPDCKPFHEYFDYLCGTSVGCLFMLAMVYFQATPWCCVSLFFKAATELLSHVPNCPKETADRLLQDTYGYNIPLSSVQVPRVIFTTCRADENPPELELICNYRETAGKIWKTWEAARSSSAAPSYFAPHEGKYIDGGIVANNPTLDSMVEIFEQGKREGKDVKFGMVLSLGTGILPKEKVTNVEMFVPERSNILKSIQNFSSTVSGLKNIFSLALSQSTHTDGTLIQQAKWWCKTLGAHYFRFSPPLTESVDLALRDKEKLAELMYMGRLYSLENAKQLDTVARLLMSRVSK